jgi:hypothetical protein
MAKTNLNKRQMLSYVGDFSQLFGIKEYTLVGGKANGVRAFDVNNGSGLTFTVLADRCLDIAGLSFKGFNCSYIGNTGITSPQYYDEKGIGFLRSFQAGFLTTCGLRNVGGPGEENGESFGLHGRISNTPAEEVSATTEWINDVPVLTISGKMREARVFGENLRLGRKIICKYGENKITIRNTVENLGFIKEQLMILFHFNLGYPLLDKDSLLLTATRKLNPRDQTAEKGKESYNRCQSPISGYAEQVFYHDLIADESGQVAAALINKKLEIGVALSYDKNQLFNFTQWKQMGEGEYVMGMEPGNCFVGGRLDPLNKQHIQYLEPGETRHFDIDVNLLGDIREIDSLAKKINDLSRRESTSLSAN